ncbi:beta-glucosidase-like [Olea europaea subsp. europaea]|uniref:Beta-glucosidase-like n=1 Tax=Olea europaea subsp. europaea TaxID=158383 RepID=A0A8S0RS20_OLEEU|nr:beta-glucosidase-like [Olea europaea subsp. europaea]
MDVQSNYVMIGNSQPFLDYQTARSTQNKMKRSDFPEDFTFGAGTSSFQIEGAWNVGGKTKSIWDVFSMTKPGNIADGSNGCVAADQYNMFRDDVALIKKVGLDSYKFSISWSRILPGGRLSTGVSREGVRYYSDLIDALLAAGIQPSITLFHWDVPQCLEDEYGGFLSRKIVKDFSEYAEVCFWEFGDRVKNWYTTNEAWSFSVQGYATGLFAPGRGRPQEAITEKERQKRTRLQRSVNLPNCIIDAGNPGTEPYIVGHNLILSHAHAVDIYRRKFQESQGGRIGMINCTFWYEPLTDSEEDRAAAARELDFVLGWFVEPLVTGEYPESMINNVGERLPKFTPEEENLVKGSYDYLGINYYTTNYISNDTTTPTTDSYLTDARTIASIERNGVPIGAKAGSDWLYVVPWGIYKLLLEIKNRYNEPIIYITENGMDDVNNRALNVAQSLSDKMRIDYHNDHLYYIKQAIKQGVNVRGYYLWSMFDNFEWISGYTSRFGIIYVDFDDGVTSRYPKDSAIWWKNFLSKKATPLKKQTEDQYEEGRKRLRRS